MTDLKPGRELDKLVAERVMGWKKALEGSCLMYPSGILYPPGLHALQNTIGHTVPSYSTDIADAWKVFEKANLESVIKMEHGKWTAKHPGLFATTDDSIQIAWPRLNDYYEVSLYQDSIILGDTAPHAICLAALKAVGAV